MAWRSSTTSRRPQSLRSGMGVKEPSLFVLWKNGFGHAGNVEGVQHLLAGRKNSVTFFPFRCRPSPPTQRELSLTCAQGEPVSPELMHEAAVDFGCFSSSGR